MARLEVQSGFHLIVQDAHDEDIGADRLVEDDVRRVFVTTQPGTELFGASPEPGMVGKLLEASCEFVTVAPRCGIRVVVAMSCSGSV